MNTWKVINTNIENMFVNTSEFLPYTCREFTQLQKHKHLKGRNFLKRVLVKHYGLFSLFCSQFDERIAKFKLKAYL